MTPSVFSNSLVKVGEISLIKLYCLGNFISIYSDFRWRMKVLSAHQLLISNLIVSTLGESEMPYSYCMCVLINIIKEINPANK